MNREQQIRKQLQSLGSKKRAAHDAGYMNTRYKLLGCNMPSIRRVTKQLIADMKETPHNEARRQLDALWKASSVFDVLYVAILYFEHRKGQNNLSDWRKLSSWSCRIDNWAHSDALSGVYADLLERFPKEIYPIMKQWNVSSRPWRRRISLTSLLYYSTLRNKPLPASKILPLVRARLNDPNIYVQKAVGWTLRECGNLYPKKTETFIKNHVLDLSSIAFSSATEKWTKRAKAPLKRKRARARKRNTSK